MVDFLRKEAKPIHVRIAYLFFKDTFKTAMTLYLKGLCPDLLSVSPSYHSYRCLNIKIKMLASHCTHFGEKKNKQTKAEI